MTSGTFWSCTSSNGVISFPKNCHNPVTKEKSREIVSAYLEKNYPEEIFKITNIAYYPSEGTYIVHVISNDGKTEGNIDVRDGKIITEGEEFPD